MEIELGFSIEKKVQNITKKTGLRTNLSYRDVKENRIYCFRDNDIVVI